MNRRSIHKKAFLYTISSYLIYLVGGYDYSFLKIDGKGA